MARLELDGVPAFRPPPPWGVPAVRLFPPAPPRAGAPPPGGSPGGPAGAGGWALGAGFGVRAKTGGEPVEYAALRHPPPLGETRGGDAVQL